MKHLGLIAAFLPSAAFAHGAHPPVTEATHGAVHVGIVLLAALAVAVIWRTASARLRRLTDR